MTARIGFGILLCTAISWAQQYRSSTVAGGAPLPSPIAATSVPLHQIGGLAADGSGNIYFTSSNYVFRLDQNGLLTRIAGNARAGYAGDGGPATSAQLSSPSSIALDAVGNILIADAGNYRVRRVSPAGIITTIAGNGQFGTPVSGSAAVQAALGSLLGITVDSGGRVLITDGSNNLVLRISTNGIITSIAGNGSYGYSGDGGPAVRARLSRPQGIVVDKAGNVFIADSSNNCIRKVAVDGTIATYAGTGFFGYSGDDGFAATAQLSNPQGLAFDSSGNLLIADSGNYRLRRISLSGVISTVAGNGTFGVSGDGGPAIAAKLASVGDIAVDSLGNVVIESATQVAGLGFAYFNASASLLTGVLISPLPLYNGSASGVSTLRRISSGGTINTIAGNNSTGLYGVGGSATNAQFGSAQGIAVDGSGNLFIADPVDDYVLKVSTSGIVTVFAGNGSVGFSGDGGLATSAQLAGPTSVAVDTSGNLFIGDPGNGRIRRVSSSGIITTVAGNGSAGYAGDGGQATNAEIARPTHIALDGAGNLYILDTVNNVVRKVSTNGVITTVAGTGSPGSSGDGGAAINAQLNNPQGLAVDAAGNIFIADSWNYAVRKVSVTGTITNVVQGNGYLDETSTGTVTQPTGVAVDSGGNLFIADTGFIRRVSAAGVITTVAGTGFIPNYGGGPATSDIAVDGSGSVWFAEVFNSDVRKLTATSQPVVINAVVDAASELATPVSPGKIVVIYGSGLGPAGGVLAAPSGGLFGTKLAGTTVSFNGIPAPVYYVSDTQVAAIVPYSISGVTAVVTVTAQAGVSSGFTVPVATASPAFFSYNSTGAGQAAARNVADGTTNSATSPAKIGSYISLYLTGEGQTTPGGVDGKLASGPVYPQPAQKVSVTVGSVPATYNYAGAVPGTVAGLMQLNVLIPAGVTPGGYVPVVVTIGTESSVSGAVWIAVSN